MKKHLILVLSLLAFVTSAFAQLSTKQLPFSIRKGVKSSINSLTLSSPDMYLINQQDNERAELFKAPRCAVGLPVEQDFFSKATKTTLTKGNLYQLSIKVEGALALNLHSSDFFIPEGGELYIFNPDKSKCLGAFTSDNNTADGMFATEYVYGDEMIIEYYQPKTTTQVAKIRITGVGYFYRDVINFEEEQLAAVKEKPTKGFYDSGSCNVNVNCSEGDSYRDVQRSTVRLLLTANAYGDQYWCTGTLINNTNNDRTPYILSAGHCMENFTSTSYFSQILVYFNYETSGCSTTYTEPSYTSIRGATYLAHDNKYGKNGGSDYLLFRLNKEVPSSINPYWSGWTRTQTASTKGVGIHHPSGDVKKISTYKYSIAGENYDDSTWLESSHWFVEWSKTTNGFGITEGGSSGSGIFNSNQLLVGMLSGGVSSCQQSSQYQFDWYGKFYVAFPYLKSWLDPLNTNDTVLNGINYAEAGLMEEQSSMSFNVYPNPAEDNINISVNMPANGVLSVLDALGRSIYSENVHQGSNQLNIDVKSWIKGTYFVRIYSKGNVQIEKIIVGK